MRLFDFIDLLIWQRVASRVEDRAQCNLSTWLGIARRIVQTQAHSHGPMQRWLEREINQ